MRQYVERQIVMAFLSQALREGHNISVHDGDEVTLWNSRSLGDIMAAMFTTDEDHVYLDAISNEHNGPPAKLLGEVYFVYGNSGPDVICDYHTSIEPLLADAHKLAEYWDAEGAWQEPPARYWVEEVAQ
jgi:hypothetical protein